MDNQPTRSESFGIRFRWLFLLGGIIYIGNAIRSIVAPTDVNRFLGFELGTIPYFILQVGVGALLLNMFIKNQKLLRSRIRSEAMEDHNTD